MCLQLPTTIILSTTFAILDGSVEVKVRASGFIYGAHWAANAVNKDEYGFRVHDALSTNMHDHILSFKADFDIAGTLIL
jgi:primary-amine oxidase